MAKNIHPTIFQPHPCVEKIGTKCFMKKDIHPKYYSKTKVRCACGNEFFIGSTQEEIETEVCSQCHPVYTGQERGAVRGGRIEKFQEKLQKQKDFQKKSKKKARKRQNQQ